MGVGAEDRYITRLNQSFDWITVDKDRNMLEAAPTDWGTGVVVHAKEQRIMSKGVYKNSVEHKYSYSGMQYVTKAYGWSDTKDHIGAWFINPTIEYLSGGPTRIDLDAHFGDNGDPEPIILDYWHSGHYDGARAQIPAGEDWTKVVGPIFVYVNSLDKPKPTTQAELDTLKATEGNPTVPASWTANANSLWQDALAQYKKQNAKWPYDWVKGVDYTPLAQRGTVTGQIVLVDPLVPKGSSTKLPHLVVGLTHPDIDPASIPRPTFAGFGPGGGAGAGPAAAAGGRPGGFGGGGGFGNFAPSPDAGSWIHDARYYQFFNDGTEDGKFAITKVRPGKYTLHATGRTACWAILRRADITVEPGKTVDLGKLVWKPVRYGKQLWEIGYPDRAADEFLKGDGQNYWLWGWNLRYALLFPNGLTYTVGKSDRRRIGSLRRCRRDRSIVCESGGEGPGEPAFRLGESGVADAVSADRPERALEGLRARQRDGVDDQVQHAEAGAGGRALRVALAGENGLRGGLPVAVNGTERGRAGRWQLPGQSAAD